MHRRTLVARLGGFALACLGWRVMSTRASAHDSLEPPASPGADQQDQPKTWEAFELDDLLTRRKESGRAYLSFLKSDSLSTGIYHLPAGAADGQSPHKEDEVYHILKGKAMLVVDGQEQPVKPGSTVYVRRTVEHRFRAIEEDLTVLVFFAAAPKG